MLVSGGASFINFGVQPERTNKKMTEIKINNFLYIKFTLFLSPGLFKNLHNLSMSFFFSDLQGRPAIIALYVHIGTAVQ